MLNYIYLSLGINLNRSRDSSAIKIQKKLKCECGAEILLIPDLAAMSRAIEEHLATHSALGANDKINLHAVSRIRDNLISQVFEKASF
jgi:hypothetical protein